MYESKTSQLMFISEHFMYIDRLTIKSNVDIKLDFTLVKCYMYRIVLKCICAHLKVMLMCCS